MRKRRRRFGFGLLGVLLVIAIPIGMTEAASGDLDSNFGSGGRVTTDFAGFSDEAHAIVVQPDGKIIAAGWTNGPVLNFALTRYNPDGSLDPSFGSGGKVSTPFAGDLAFGNAVALQSDGKIVVAGWTQEADIALARYNADGSLDSGFGVGGTVTTDLGSHEQARAVAIQPDGRIVVVGVSGLHSVVVRYTSSGSLDPGFGSGGVVSVDFATPPNSIGMALALQSDGKIVIAGSALTGTANFDLSFDFALARLNSDGSFDSSFGSDGKVTTSFGPAMDDHAMAIAIQPDGKIVATGDAFPQGGSATKPDFALARYNADGSLDVGFGSGGIVITDFSLTDDRARAVALQVGGKIVAAGFTGDFVPPFNKDFALARYNANGSVDNSFGSGGKVTTDFGGGNDEVGGIALQPDGKLVAVGFTSFALSGGDVNFALARYLGDPATLPVSIDIKPGSYPNSINLGSCGKVPVAIFSAPDAFDATMVDPTTVRLVGAGVALKKDGRAMASVQDVDGDGLMDLVVHFNTQALQLTASDTMAVLTGRTFGGTTFGGTDSVRVVGSGPPPCCTRPPARLTGWWPGDGNTRDIIGRRNAVLHGNATYGPGFVDQAFRLDRDEDWVEVPDAPALNVGTGDFTIDLWVYFNDTAGEQILVEKYIQGPDQPSSRGWSFMKSPDNYVGVHMSEQSIDWGVGSPCPLPIPVGTWNHFAATREGTQFTVFMNGVPVAVSEIPFMNLNSTSSLKFGHRGNPIDTPGSVDESGFFLNGRIDEVELFVGRALTQEEIQGIFNAGRAGKCKKTVRCR